MIKMPFLGSVFSFLAVGALLVACSAKAPVLFDIEARPLEASELDLSAFQNVNFKAQVFDVVNQDVEAVMDTGLSTLVNPMPADVIAAYAAQKFNAVGGADTATRLVIRDAHFQTRAVKGDGDEDYRASMELDLSVTLIASDLDGPLARIDAHTRQVRLTSFDSTAQQRRVAYLELMMRALNALDVEISKELPQQFNALIQ